MKTYKSLLLGLSAVLMSSCHPALFEDIDEAMVSVNPDMNISYSGNILNVKKGTPINFNLNGDPDFVSFFSGEEGHQFIYRNEAHFDKEDVDTIILTFKLKSNHYADYKESVKGNLKVYYNIEHDTVPTFPGLAKDNFEADSVLVETAKYWTLMTDDEQLITEKDNKQDCKNVKPFVMGIPKTWWDQKVTMAIVRNPQKQVRGKEKTYVSSGVTEHLQQAEFDFENMCLITRLKNGSEHVTMAGAFGLTPLNMTCNTVFEDLEDDQFTIPKDPAYGSTQVDVSGFCNMSGVGNGKFTMKGTKKNEDWRYTWLVSDYLDFLSRPFHDTGIKVKEVSQSVNGFTYTYEKVGTYKATFYMNNENFDDEEKKLQEFVINVVD